MRSSLALLGGTFDPVHNAHIRTAKELKSRLGFDRVELIPCGDPYHKQNGLSADKRAYMLALALSQEDSLDWDDRELLRSGPTYTVDTLNSFRKEVGLSTHISWVVGQDAAKELYKWHNWDQLFGLANLVIVARPGELWPNMEDWPAKLEQDKQAFMGMSHGGVYCIALTPDPVSSTLVRQRVRNHQEIDDLVPKSVASWIKAQGLYQTKC